MPGEIHFRDEILECIFDGLPATEEMSSLIGQKDAAILVLDIERQRLFEPVATKLPYADRVLNARIAPGLL